MIHVVRLPSDCLIITKACEMVPEIYQIFLVRYEVYFLSAWLSAMDIEKGVIWQHTWSAWGGLVGLNLRQVQLLMLGKPLANFLGYYRKITSILICTSSILKLT